MRRNLPELFSHSLRGARPCISFLGSVIPYAAVRYGRPRLVGFRASVYIRSAKLVEESYRTYLVVLRPRADPVQKNFSLLSYGKTLSRYSILSRN